MEDWRAFDEAAGCLPRELRLAAQSLPEEIRSSCEELRLRAGRYISWSDPFGEHPILISGQPLPVSEDDLRMMVELATRSSFHSALERLRSGFVTLKGGHRLGLCGTVTTEGGMVRNFLHLSSVNLRIAREKPGVGEGLLPQLMEERRLASTLILSPTGNGKTTLLRDLVRQLSDGPQALRVGLVDERGEVASLYHGVPQMNVGVRTDVVDGCPKSTGLLFLLRGMNPNVLAVDEITAPEDVEALTMAANCGVSLLATAHGGSREDLERRPLYRRLLEQGIFRYLLRIELTGGRRDYRVEPLE